MSGRILIYSTSEPHNNIYLIIFSRYVKVRREMHGRSGILNNRWLKLPSTEFHIMFRAELRDSSKPVTFVLQELDVLMSPCVDSGNTCVAVR